MTANARPPQGEAAQGGAPPSGLTPPSGAATAEYSAEASSRLASIRERLAKPVHASADARECSYSYGGPNYAEEDHRDGRCRYAPHWSPRKVMPADDVAWLIARLDVPRESSAIAAPEGSA